MPHLTPPRPWAALTDEEWSVLAPHVTHRGAGRPAFDIRGRLNAIFRVVTSRQPWRTLPQEYGPWDTAHRQFRRWAHAGVWEALLRAVARRRAPAALRGMEHWLCCAFRRAWRILGLRGVVLARRLGFRSALRGPAWMVPDPDLSEQVFAAVDRALNSPLCRAVLSPLRGLLRLAGGRASIPRCLEPL